MTVLDALINPMRYGTDDLQEQAIRVRWCAVVRQRYAQPAVDSGPLSSTPNSSSTCLSA